jgi:putative phosphoribosyl transferase
VVGGLCIPENVIDDASERELERRERIYREGRPAPDVHGRIVILIDDGPDTCADFQEEADEAVLRRRCLVP